MGFFSEICNPCLIRELQHELNTDVILFGADGMSYYGNLQAIDDGRIAILSPAMTSTSSDVKILTPGGELQEVTFVRVDLWSIVGKATGIKNEPTPFDPPPFTAPANGTLEEKEGRQESHLLIRQLKRMIGDGVVITTLGGFLFEGVLSDVRDELAILTVDDIFAPGTSTSISDTDVRSAVVNLEALTSVSGTATS